MVAHAEQPTSQLAQSAPGFVIGRPGAEGQGDVAPSSAAAASAGAGSAYVVGTPIDPNSSAAANAAAAGTALSGIDQQKLAAGQTRTRTPNLTPREQAAEMDTFGSS